MPLADEPIDFAVHSHLKSVFVILDDSLPGDKYRVISPDGNIIVLAGAIFHESVDRQPLSLLHDRLTPIQRGRLENYLESSSRLIDAEQASFKVENAEANSPTSRRSSKRVEQTRAPRLGIVVKWRSEKLTFFRHHIEPLKGNQQFSVTVDDVGEFVMTKNEFLSVFNSVVMSKAYREGGLHSYEEVPEFAKRFLKTGRPQST